MIWVASDKQHRQSSTWQKDPVGGIAGVIGAIVLMMSAYEAWRQHQPTVSVVEALQRP